VLPPQTLRRFERVDALPGGDFGAECQAQPVRPRPVRRDRVEAALGGRQSWLAIVLALNTALSLYYYLRLIQPLYFGTQSASAKHNLPIALRFALIVFAAGSIITGVLPGAFVRFAAHSAQIISK